MIPFILPVINELSRKIVRQKFVRSIMVPDGAEVEYLKYGKGPTLLIILGLGDGVRTVKDISLILMFTFLAFARKHQLVIISRRNPLEEHTTVEQIADDFLFAVNELDLKDVFIWGNSAGGPIAQAMSLLKPEKVKGLILSKTFCRPNKEFIEKVQAYIVEFKQKNLTRFIEDTVPFRLKSRTLKRLNQMIYFIAARLMRRHGEDRVFHILTSLLTFDQLKANQSLQCPVLIFTDKNDMIVPIVMQEELVTSYSNAKVVTTATRGEGHLITLKSLFLYQREITRFISESESRQTLPNIQLQTTKINNM